jgi:hypothetical protein
MHNWADTKHSSCGACPYKTKCKDALHASPIQFSFFLYLLPALQNSKLFSIIIQLCLEPVMQVRFLVSPGGINKAV